MKTTLSANDIQAFLQKQVGPVSDLSPMVEGEVSQAYSFSVGAEEFVIRIQPSLMGYQKDHYAYQNFSSASVPIPQVEQLGNVDNDHAFCISRKIPGTTFQDVDEASMGSYVQPVHELWEAVGATDISSTEGFGVFDQSGYGQAKSWQAFVLALIDDNDWAKVSHLIDADLLAAVSGKLQELVVHCPEDRYLVHGDFGSNNVLVDAGKITALLDWELGLYGDPLFDVAIAYFWRTWLPCMETMAVFWGEQLADLPNYHTRLYCYQLRIGLHELFSYASDGDIAMVDWIQNRCRQILSETAT